MTVICCHGDTFFLSIPLQETQDSMSNQPRALDLYHFLIEVLVLFTLEKFDNIWQWQ